jgi:hypothetical protein
MFAVEGQLDFMGAAIDTLEPLEQSLGENDWEESSEYFRNNPVLYRRTSPTALAGLEVIVAVSIFTATCFATKIADEFYERLLKRPVGACIEALLEKIALPAGRLLEFRDIVYFEDFDVAVVVRILTKKADKQIIDTQLIEVHRIAYDYLSRNGRKAPIHCHRVLEGKVDAAPEFFINIDCLQNNERAHLIDQGAEPAPNSNFNTRV